MPEVNKEKVETLKKEIAHLYNKAVDSDEQAMSLKLKMGGNLLNPVTNLFYFSRLKKTRKQIDDFKKQADGYRTKAQEKTLILHELVKQ